MKKLLLISFCELKREFGAAKHLIELSEEMAKIGWDCTLVPPNEIHKDGLSNLEQYQRALRDYLRQNARKYDVAEYGQYYLPFSRQDFPEETLMVARSVLLHYHFFSIKMPTTGGTLKEFLYHHTKGRLISYLENPKINRNITTTFHEADLINVNNSDDKKELMRRGFHGSKVAVIPCGLSDSARQAFHQISSKTPGKRQIAFIGTYERRKGSLDLPVIFKLISDALPDVTFKLLGTYFTKEQIQSRFSSELTPKITVIPSYSSDQLPSLLEDCTVGVFPSYVEGFGLGVLEMLAASIPVFAYNAPGPPMMLTEEYLSARGDKQGMADKIINLLKDEKRLAIERSKAKETSLRFTWKNVAAQTDKVYTSYLSAVRSNLLLA